MNTTFHLTPTIIISGFLICWGLYRTAQTTELTLRQKLYTTTGPSIYGLGVFLLGLTYIPFSTVSLHSIGFGVSSLVGLYIGSFLIIRSKEFLGRQHTNLFQSLSYTKGN